MADRLYRINPEYRSDTRRRHATVACKIDDLLGVRYGLGRLMHALAEVQALQQDSVPGDLADEVAAWMEFVLLRLELHSGDEPGYAFKEYAAALSQDEKEQLLLARQLRRSHIQHLSAKWLRESTYIDSLHDTEAPPPRALLVRQKDPERKSIVLSEHEYELPNDPQTPFYVIQTLSPHCLDWKVLVSAIDKVLLCLSNALCNLQAKMISEINSLSYEERRVVLVEYEQ